MENTSHSLGLYLTRTRALAVWLSQQDQGTLTAVLDIQPNEGQSAQTIALEAVRRIRQRGAVIEQAYIALDCSYYTQYSLHSEFSDMRQVESTIKFDAEEAAATDAMNLAVTFAITGPLPTGSEVMAFTADRQTVTDILLDVQEAGLDPVMMEPDVVCLVRTLEHTLRVSEHPDTLFVLAGAKNGYFVQPGKSGYTPRLRTFLLDNGPRRVAAMAREILLAMAGWDDQTPLKTVVFVQPPAEIDLDQLAARTGLDVRVESTLEKLHTAVPLDSGLSAESVLIAAGAALAPLEKGISADFRRDFMPYQGRRKMLQSSLRVACISLTVLLGAVGLFFQSKSWRVNACAQRLDTKLAEEYRGAMYGINPPTTESIPSRLRRELINIKRVQEGLGPGDDKSVPAKLTFLLEAINNSPASVDVVVQQITITERTMRVKGDTNGRPSTLVLFESIKKHPRLKFGQERMSMAGNRDTFEFTVEPAQ